MTPLDCKRIHHFFKFQMMSFEEIDDELVFLYQLVDGSANFSHALQVAGRMGLPAKTLERAADVSSQ